MKRSTLILMAASVWSLLSGARVLAGDKEGISFRGKPLAFWVALLKEEDPLLREEGLEVISALGSVAKEASAQVERLLLDDVPSVRFKAATAALKLGAVSERALAVLRERMQSPRRDFRAQVVSALLQRTQDGPEIVALLVEASADLDTAVQRDAGDELVRLGGKATPQLIALLDHEDPRRQKLAMQLLLRQGPAARSGVDALLKRLTHKDANARFDAAHALWGIDRRFKEAASVWGEALGASELPRRERAFEVVARIRPVPPEIKAGLEGGLEGGTIQTRLQALRALQELEPAHPRLLPVLKEALQSKQMSYNRHVGLPAFRAVIKLGRSARPLEAILVKHAQSGDYHAAQALAAALGKDAAPHLLRLITDKKSSVLKRQAAFGALAALGADGVAPLMTLLGAPQRDARLGAVTALAQIGPPAKAAVATLTKLLKDADVAMVRVVAHCLGRVGKDALPAAAALREALKPSHAGAWPVVLAALESIGADGKETAAVLRPGLMHESRPHRLHVARALWGLERDDKALLPVLLELLETSEATPGAITLLSEMGAAAKPAVPALVRLMENKAAAIRYQAMDALGALGPAAKEAGPGLKMALSDDRLKLRAASALSKIGVEEEAAGAVLVEACIKAPFSLTPLADLRRLGRKAAGAAPRLRTAIDETPQIQYRLTFMELLQAIDPDAAGFLRPRLLEHLGATDRLVVWRAAVLLARDEGTPAGRRHVEKELEESPASSKGKVPFSPSWAVGKVGVLGADGKFALPALERWLQDEEAETRVAAALSWWEITKDPARPLAVLLQVLDGEEVNRGNVARFQAARALGAMGVAAKEALPALLEACRGERDSAIRQACLEATRRIDPKNAPLDP